MKRRWVAAVVLAAAIPLYSQMTVNVRVIEVPVTVVDRGGNAVRGLTAANFELFDDGKPQKITAFEAIDFASTESLSAISPLNAQARRSFLLLFDLGYADVNQLARARAAATHFLAATVKPRDLVSVGSIEPQRGFRLLTGFTTDRNVVAAAVADPRKYRGADPLQLSDLDAFGADSGTAESAGKEGAVDADDATGAEIKELAARVNRAYVAGRIDKQVASLAELARTLRSVPGRKQVVLLSAGFDPTMLRGRDARGSMNVEVAEMNLVMRGRHYRIDSDQRFGNSASQTVIAEMAKVFNQSDVVMHAIDVAGVRVDDTLNKHAVNPTTDALHLLADPTGGTVFERTNNLGEDFDRMMREQEVVYVLAFQTAPGKEGRLHSLNVRLVNGPAGATVHNRVAWYDGAATTPVERALTNAEIIVNDIAQKDIHVAALAAAVPPVSERAAVPLFLEIRGGDLLRDATKPVQADIFVYAFDEQGVVRDRIYQRIAVDPAQASGKVKESGIKYYSTLTLPPGKYAIRSLVALPESEKRGYVRTDVVVPAAAEMAVLPPLFSDKPGQWAMLTGIRHDASPYPFHLNGESFVPSALPRLRIAGEGEFVLFLYNANPDEMMMQATATDAKGVTRPAAPELVRQIRGEGVTKLVFRWAPSGLAAGPATLDILIHKKGSPEVRRASVMMMVE